MKGNSNNMLLWLFLLALILASFIAFSSSLKGGLIWDDKDLILKDPRIRSLSNFSSIWSGPFATEDVKSKGIRYYRPITTLSFMIDYQRSGEAPEAYHQTNVLLHILVTVVVFFIVRRIFPGAWPPFLVALLFALHPSRTENVAWISGRTDLMGGLFLFLSMLLFLIHGERGKRWLRFLSLFSFVLALCSKESMIVLPFILALYAFFTMDKGNVLERAWHAARKTWPFFLVAFLFFIFLNQMGVFQGKANQSFSSPLEHVLYVLHTLVLYAGLIFFPLRFSTIATAIIPEGVKYHALPEHTAAAVFLILLALFILTLWGWFYRSRKLLSFSLLAWIVALLPALNIVPLPAVVSTRLLYVPLFFVLLALWGLWQALLAVLAKRKPRLQYAGVILSLLLALVLGSVTYSQNFNWKSEDVFWKFHLAEAPDSPNVQCYMGLHFSKQGKNAEALPYFQEANRLAPDHPLFLLYLGHVYKGLKRYAEAEECYKGALDLQPGYAKAVNRLAVLYVLMGRNREAFDMFEKSVTMMPNDPRLHQDFGIFLYQRNDLERAAREFRAVLEIEPGNQKVRGTLQQVTNLLESRKGKSLKR